VIKVATARVLLPVFSIWHCNAIIGDWLLVPIVIKKIAFRNFSSVVTEDIILKNIDSIGFVEMPDLYFDDIQEGIFAKRIGNEFSRVKNVTTTHNTTKGTIVRLVWPDKTFWEITEENQKFPMVMPQITASF